jgi:putative membrane protein
MKRNVDLVRGLAAGLVGGLVASWVMNEFMSGPGTRLQEAVQSPEQNERQAIEADAPKEDATMKAADAIASTVRGGTHLTWEQREKSGPLVHYAFGGAMGALYGAMAEVWPSVRSGFGVTFGAALFTGADLIGVPVLRLSGSPGEQPITSQASPLAAHLVYGLATELFRRFTRAVL